MHKYHIAQTVTFSAEAGSLAAAGAYEIIQLLPPDTAGIPQYRIKTSGENYERVVRESQLSEAR